MGRILEVIGRNLMLFGGSIDATGSFVQPLMAPGGGIAVAANTANQAFSVAASGRFGYMTDAIIIVTLTAAVAGTIAILDSSGGTVLWGIGFGAGVTYTASCNGYTDNSLGN